MKDLYQEMFAEIHASDRLREEVIDMTKREQKGLKRHRFSAALAAAVILAAALAGTAVAALAIPGTIQEWFAQQWAAPMEAGQTEVIDSLTQKIGVSSTDHGMTVTVDSATVGDSVLWLLLRVDGKDFQALQQDEADREYFVQGLKFKLIPEKEGEEAAEYGYDLPFVGAGEGGTLLMLLRFVFVMPGEQSLLDGNYQVQLHMEGLDTLETDVFQGTWDFSFALEPMEDQQVLSVGTITVSGERLEPRETVEVELHDVEVSATGLQYTMAEKEEPEFEEMVHIFSSNWELEMKDGRRLSHNGGTGHWSPENGGQRISSYYWITPIDLDQVKALWFGQDCYPLN